MADRWFVTPPTAFERTDKDGNVIETETVPKYSDDNRLDGFAGNVITIGATDPWSVFATVGMDEDYYITRFYGPSDALDDIASNSEVTDLSQVSNTKYWIRVILNDQLNKDLTADEWIDKFEVGV